MRPAPLSAAAPAPVLAPDRADRQRRHRQQHPSRPQRHRHQGKAERIEKYQIGRGPRQGRCRQQAARQVKQLSADILQ